MIDRFKMIELLSKYSNNKIYADGKSPVIVTNDNDIDTYYLYKEKQENIIAIVSKNYDKKILIDEFNLSYLIDCDINSKLREKIYKYLYENEKMTILGSLFKAKGENILVEFTGFSIMYYLKHKSEKNIIVMDRYNQGTRINEINLQKLINCSIETNLKEKITQYLKQ